MLSASVSAIRVSHIAKRFGKRDALRDITFDVAPGEVFGLVGPNGAGKSTLIRILSTLVRPCAGTAFVGPHSVTDAPNAVRRLLGVVPQAHTSDPHMSVEENLRLFAKLYEVPAAKRRQRIPEAMEAVGVLEHRSTPVKNLSGGLRRRVEIARALVHEPAVLILDEPTSSLDPVSRTNIWSVIKTLVRDRGMALVLATHYMEEAESLCDRVAILNTGRIVALDSPGRMKQALRKNDVIDLVFEEPGQQRDWAAALSTLPGLVSIAQAPSGVTIESTNGFRTLQALSCHVEDQQARIASCSMRPITLNDVFAHYTSNLGAKA
ncbi:MAG: ABC transporter ATP-binding protein [Hyphomicrobium sp.]